MMQGGRGYRSLLVRAANITSNDFRPGVTLELDGAPWRVQGAHAPMIHCLGVPICMCCISCKSLLAAQ